MKFTLLIASVLLCANSWAQTLPISVFDCSINSPEVTQQEIDDNDDFYKQCILFTDTENYAFDQDDHKTVTATTEIRIKENFQAGAFSSNGKMHLRIAERQNLDVFSMNQPDLGAIPQFDKFELGLDLPSDIDVRIEDFFQNTNQSTSLNPFNPEEIDVEARYYWYFNGQEYGPRKTFGFYYEEFERDASLTSWNEITQDYSFRIRFAPRNVGTWKCLVTVKINGVIAYEATPFYFQVVSSNLLDFTTIGQNNAFFKIGNEGYFPVGQNEPSVGIESTFRQPFVRPPADYLSYHQTIQDLHSTGANYYRMLSTPWGIEIEFEELGNFKNRMPNAWEMDRILDLTKDLENSTGEPFRMHFNMTIHNHFETVAVYSINSWDWAPGNTTFYSSPCIFPNDNGYCYATPNNALYPGVANPKPKDFISSEEAKKYYKRRLRYMVARWGYSTSINLFEILSEANNTGIWGNLQPVYDPGNGNVIGCPQVEGASIEEPYKNDPNFPALIYAWHHDMAAEIKQNTAHPHPVAVNYTGFPNQDGVKIDGGDLSYLSTNIDVMTYNHYGLSHDKFKKEGDLIRQFRDDTNTPHIKKPMMYSEIGLSPCDNNMSWKKQTLLSGFTGSAGTGIPWQHSHQDGPELAAERLVLWQIYGFVADFFDGRKLDDDDYRSDHWIRNDKKAELLYLRSFGDNNGPKMAIGAVHNLTVNYYTMRDGGSNPTCNLNLDSAVARGVPLTTEIVSHAGGNNKLKMKKMGGVNRYEIRWWNPLTGEELPTRTQWSTPTGRLRIKYDDLSDDFSKAILFCQVRHNPVNGMFAKDTIEEVTDDAFKGFTLIDNSSPESTNPLEDSNVISTQQDLIVCFPNPTESSIAIELLGKVKDSHYDLALRDAMGAHILMKKNRVGQTQLDLSGLEDGIYHLIVTVEGLTLHEKIVKCGE